MPAEPTQPDRGATQPHGVANAAVGMLPPGLIGHPDYEIIRELGGGGMGVVYLAHNRLNGPRRGPQGHRPQIVERPEAPDRFQREIRAVAPRRRPNIVIA